MRFKHRRRTSSRIGRWVRKPTDHRRSENKPSTMEEFHKMAKDLNLRVTEHVSDGGRTFLNVVDPEGRPRTIEIKETV